MTAPTTSKYKESQWGLNVPRHMRTCTWGGWEQNLLRLDDVHSFFEHIPLWRRFIDDVLFVWTGPQEDLMLFLNSLKQNDYNLKFTYEISQRSLTFLDVQISIDDEGTIETSLFRKSLAGNSLLHATSSHPKSLISNIPYGQYLRIRRNCSTDSNFEYEAKLLQQRFQERGYSKKGLKKAYLRAKKQKRSSLLHDPKAPKTDPGMRLITRFSGHHQKVRSILQKYWCLLLSDNTVAKHIQDHPQITFKKSRSLRDRLVITPLQIHVRVDQRVQDHVTNAHFAVSFMHPLQ